MRHP
jgi:hypothetical protein